MRPIDALNRRILSNGLLWLVDDSKLYLKFKTSELCDAISAVNSDLREICRWCCQNSLLMDPDKTKLLVIGVPTLLQQLPDFTITLCGKPILPTPVAKDLGVFLVLRSMPGGGGLLPYMTYIGMCRCEGYGFQRVYSRIGCRNQRVLV